MTQAAHMNVFPHGTDNSIWISTYSEACLSRKNPGTIDVYQRVLHDFLLWLDARLGQTLFHLNQLTRPMIYAMILRTAHEKRVGPSKKSLIT